jgi:hypothetical protein
VFLSQPDVAFVNHTQTRLLLLFYKLVGPGLSKALRHLPMGTVVLVCWTL